MSHFSPLRSAVRRVSGRNPKTRQRGGQEPQKPGRATQGGDPQGGPDADQRAERAGPEDDPEYAAPHMQRPRGVQGVQGVQGDEVEEATGTWESGGARRR